MFFFFFPSSSSSSSSSSHDHYLYVYENKINFTWHFRKCIRQKLKHRITLSSLPVSAYSFLADWVTVYMDINNSQQDATVCRHLFTAKSLYMFRVSFAPITRST
jgi:hypothetical protein